MNINYIFTLLVLSSLSMNGMQDDAKELAQKAAIAFHWVPVNKTDSAIKVSGMTGIKPRLGQERPWSYENFGPKSEKKETHFLYTETMRIETDIAIFEVACPQEMIATIVAFGTLKKTQESIEAKKFRFLLSGETKIRLIINDASIDFEDITSGCKPFIFPPLTKLPVTIIENK